MTAIEEDFVSFETAKLLKEKGFYKPCYRHYDNKGDICGKYVNPDIPFNYSSVEYYLCPSQSMAMKWLREVHNIQIELNWEKGNQLYSFQIWKPGKFQPEISSLDLWRIYKDDNYLGEWDYEQACEAAIGYCLENLI